MKTRRLTRTVLALCATVAGLSGCALPPVQPWEKGQLARPDMLIQEIGRAHV